MLTFSYQKKFLLTKQGTVTSNNFNQIFRKAFYKKINCVFVCVHYFNRTNKLIECIRR